MDAPLATGVLTAAMSAGDTSLSARDFVRRVYEEERVVVWRYVTSLGVGPDEAQELTQDVFVRLYLAVRNGTAIRTPRSWLFAVASNLVLDRYRASVRDSVTAREDATRWLHAHLESQGNPEEIVLGREKVSALQDAIRTLSQQQQICLHLRAEGLRYREIAGILHVRVSTVSEFLSRAIRRLRTVLDE